MTGMMTDMQQISKSARARSGPTPEFVELCKALYGDVVDPEIVWTDVIKLSPNQADQGAHATRRRVLNGAALAGTAAGSVLGVSELARSSEAVAKPGGRVARLAAKVPEIPGGPKAKLGLAATMLGADVLATNELRPRKQGLRKRSGQFVPTGYTSQDVEKFSLSSLKKPEEIAAGLKRLWQPKPSAEATGHRAQVERGLSMAAGTYREPQASAPGTTGLWQGAQTKGQDRARAAGKDIGTAMSTKTGKVVAGAAVVGGAHHVARGRGSAGYEEYGKAEADVEFRGEFTKFDDSKRQAFGWASVVKVNGAPVVDRQGDYIDLEDLEDAAYAYVHKSRVGGDMHRRNGEAAHKVSDMIESMVFTPEKIAKMGLPEDFPQGWWVGYKIHDEDTWSEVRKGGRTGFSIHGKGLRKDHNLDELMGY